MLALISFILVLVGCVNWLSIGLLQFDFVAGIFGSQANIFSRIVYVVIGVAALIVCINLIKNKGKLTFNLKKMNKETARKEPVFVSESSKDMSANNMNKTDNTNNMSYDNIRDNRMETSSEFTHDRNTNYNENDTYDKID